MKRLVTLALASAIPLTLAACEVQENDSVPPAGETPNDAAANSVVRDEVPATDQPVVTASPVTVIQSQPGPDGSQVDLLSVKVTGDILTVNLRCSSEKKYNIQSFKISQISVIDDATSQRIGVLKDNEGNAIVSDLQASGNPDSHLLRASCTSSPGVMWAKFPAPPPTSETVSISLPKVGPFDGVPVTR